MLKLSPLRAAVHPLLSWATAGVWTLASAGFAFWVLKWPSLDSSATVPTLVATSQSSSDQSTQSAKALGQPYAKAASPMIQATGQHKLMGVIASVSGQGSALIATDGQPPKAYRVGQTLQDGWTLTSLTARQARLKSDRGEVLLELPLMDKP